MIFVAWRSTWDRAPDIRYHEIVGPDEVLPEPDDDERREAVLSFRCADWQDPDGACNLVLDALSFNSWQLAHLMNRGGGDGR